MNFIKRYLAYGPYLIAAVFVATVGAASLSGLMNANANDAAQAQAQPAQTETHVVKTRAASEVELIDIDDLPVIQAILGYAPNAAPPVDRGEPALVEVDLITTEEVMKIAPGVPRDERGALIVWTDVFGPPRE